MSVEKCLDSLENIKLASEEAKRLMGPVNEKTKACKKGQAISLSCNCSRRSHEYQLDGVSHRFPEKAATLSFCTT